MANEEQHVRDTEDTSLGQGKYLLVSDSNESIQQYDSKKLDYAELVEMAQDNLFKKHLDIMDLYMTLNQFRTYRDVISEKLDIQSGLWDNKIRDGTNHMLRVEDGQVILMKKSEVDDARDDKSPLDYLMEYWHIPADYQVEQIHDCMLRGTTELRHETTMKESNQKVALSDENMPPHMHHSGITTGARMQTMDGVEKQSSGNHNPELATVYDMFRNDSFSTGLSKNEMDGVVDRFEVSPTGDTYVQHENMPLYERYYAFIIHKVSA